MSALYDTNTPKKATNVTINGDLLKQAKAYKINLSQSFEKHLSDLVRKEKERRWLEENAEAIALRNKLVEERGVFSDAFRRF
jgi:antitoxin CcdA